MRVLTTLAGLILAAVTVLGAPAQATSPLPTTAGPTAERSLPRSVPPRPGATCRQRQLNPRRTVPAARFARCVVIGMQRGRTATLVTRHTPGTAATAAARFTPTRTDASVSYSDGSRLVMLKGRGWYKPAGKGWVRPGTGSEDALLARAIVTLWNSTSSPASYRRALRASSTGWQASGAIRRINGQQAREYLGTVTLGPVTFSRYAVWVDRLDRPVRISSTGTLSGVTVTTRQDFKRWGKPVRIVPPTRG